ncbi:hypothetical protein BCR44DRAFT_34453 [Catenaria anguillulae PL171]|uniref:DNA-directed RNA polymerase II subunit RPB9 n=1 Tax=Catenaria anguillulae PL171 TaxID=765915 RepID=A0A1Y2I2Q8_9FUNG|nr:hypothetical protein BCR44DRAFT_34453 [Catenaria anguillulae PL171]
MSIPHLPAMNTAHSASARARARFCLECSNLMYPKEQYTSEGYGAKQLIYACRQPACTYTEEAMDPVVYRHEVRMKEAAESNRVDFMMQDPTLPRADVRCAQCQRTTQAIYYQSRSQHKDAKMILFYMCTVCMHQWDSAVKKDGSGTKRE